MRKFLFTNIVAYATIFLFIGIAFGVCDVHAKEILVLDEKTTHLLSVSINGQKMDVEYIYYTTDDPSYCIVHLPYRQGTFRVLRSSVLVCEEFRECVLDPKDYIVVDNIDN